MSGLRIEFPGAPDLDLSPNRRYRKGGYHKGIGAVAALRAMNFDTLAVSLAPPVPLEGGLEYEALICWGHGQRFLDFDNAVGVLKSYIDLLEVAGWMKNDRQIKRATVEQVRSRSIQFVEIEVREI